MTVTRPARENNGYFAKDTIDWEMTVTGSNLG